MNAILIQLILIQLKSKKIKKKCRILSSSWFCLRFWFWFCLRFWFWFCLRFWFRLSFLYHLARATTYLKHLGSTNRTCALNRRSSIFHCHLLLALDRPFCFTFYTITFSCQHIQVYGGSL
jgi:hypothetical protein